MHAVAIASGRVITTMAANNEVAVPRRNRDNVMTGELPDDFLRIQGGGASPAMMPANPVMFGGHQQLGGILSITIVQARLAKNYGVTRMDPYCRVRIGMQVFETPTAYNGSKSPRWNKTIQCHIPDQVNEFYFEIFDERTFSIDERVAWGMIKIKDEVFNGESVEDWYTLSGKQGDEKEGMVNLVLQYRKSNAAPTMMGPMMGGQMVMQPMVYPGGYVYGYPPMMYSPQMMAQVPMQQQQQQQQRQNVPAPVQINPKDLQTLKEMCPELDDEIIKVVLQETGGNLDRAAATLVEMNNS
ncbi:toll-interacting protein B-like [Hydractinia symbiolongicarpus]|uniref:toll-interacting protein B-like n=1 Tax=Hydractinia symbiolongicarpus TaxID=13093 RepID=UPI0025506ADC|nr:toll-interacting protein B-like [Hydractinia symbiolongicarpus]